MNVIGELLDLGRPKTGPGFRPEILPALLRLSTGDGRPTVKSKLEIPSLLANMVDESSSMICLLMSIFRADA